MMVLGGVELQHGSTSTRWSSLQKRNIPRSLAAVKLLSLDPMT